MLTSFMPHGMCFAWRPDVLALHVASDALIALAYFSIPLLLLRFAHGRRDLPFRSVFSLFAVFIAGCGTTHLLAIAVIWYPIYWIEGWVKALTAAASLATAAMMVPLLPRALALRSPRELERANAELERALRDLAREHHVASRFQTAALATALPAVDDLVFSASYDAAVSELGVGGDWYDAFPLADGRVAVTIGDVSGKGLEAAIIMGKVRQSLRAAAAIQVEPGAILEAADRTLRGEYPDRVVTAFVGIVDRVESVLTYANAGHPWPLVRRADGTIDELRSIALPLGLREPGAAAAATTPLGVGDTLVLFTDGLIEATHDIAGGEARLRAAVAALDGASPDAARRVRDTVLEGGAPDDVAILVVHRAQEPGDGTLLRRALDAADGAGARAVRTEIATRLERAGAGEAERLAAELIFSELIGNVVRHAPGPAEVALDTGGALPVLHVLDRGTGVRHVPRLPTDPYAERGRGLFLVAALSDDFHVVPRAGGGSHASVVLRVGGRGGRLDDAALAEALIGQLGLLAPFQP